MQCPLWVKSRHSALHAPCPLYPRKQTFVGSGGMSAKGQYRTLANDLHRQKDRLAAASPKSNRM